MKRSLIILLTMLFILSFSAIKINAQGTVNETVYDSVLAQNLGADEFGMKHYVMAFLTKGSKRSQDSTRREEIQKAHLNNIIRLANEGKQIMAGPFLDDTDIRGIFIFNVESIEEAKKLTETDPAVKAGVLSMELHSWYGPAILPEVIRLNKKLEKKSIME